MALDIKTTLKDFKTNAQSKNLKITFVNNKNKEI
jgi:hypothetical protein